MVLTRRAREVALTQHIGVSAETDRAVVPKLRQAYDSLVCGRRRLGAIGAEIENAVAHQRALGLDTPAVARNFSRFLATKAHDITRVLAATAAESQAGAARLRSLASSYQAVGFGPKPQEPPPDPVPFPPYQPKVWAACRARGQDPDKVVRTFHHAPMSARFRSLPAGD
ncbi:hypothetical protein DPZ17_27285, partial [Klebsiella pneumoniae]